MPSIMDLLERLPKRPEIRYAATLVISRYAFWTSHHPHTITYQLNFISAGFQNEEVASASALALNNLSKSCAKASFFFRDAAEIDSRWAEQHLVGYIEQLREFYVTVSKVLPFRDQFEVTEAMARIIAVIPPVDIPQGLQFFCLPVANDLRAMLAKPAESMKKKTTKGWKVSESLANDEQTSLTRTRTDLLERIGIFFELVRPDIQQGEHPCVLFAAGSCRCWMNVSIN